MNALLARPRWHALVAAVALPFSQAWTDTGLISSDDDWSSVAGVVGHRGDGLAAAAGADPRLVLADGAATPLDVSANEPDPLRVSLPAGIAEFELPDPVVALQGSATAAAPHLLLSLDTRGRSGIAVRYRLRDVDASAANAVQAVALQYRVGETGPFANVPGGFVPDATAGPGQAGAVSPVAAALPAAADNRPLVQVRVITANAAGQDEWVGVDDVAVTAGGAGCVCPGGCGCAPPAPPSMPGPPGAGPGSPALAISDLELAPPVFTPARRGSAVVRTGRSGTGLRYRLSAIATVRFEVQRVSGPAATRRRPAGVDHGSFTVYSRRGLNRVRFTGRLRGRPLARGSYRLEASVPAKGRPESTAVASFRIRR